MMKSNSGFTLLELLIVIALIGIGSTSIVVGFQLVFDTRVESAGEKLVYVLREMRYETTTKLDREYTFEFLYENNKFGYKVVTYDTTKAKTEPPIKEAKTIFPKKILVHKLRTGEDGKNEADWELVSDILTAGETQRIRISFSGYTGGVSVLDYGNQSVSGDGIYRFTTDDSATNIKIRIDDFTGRVDVYEEK